MLRTALWTSAFLIASACHTPAPPAEVPEPTTQVPETPPPNVDPNEIGIGGGQISERGVTLSVPAGALAEATILQVIAGTKVASGRYAEAGGAFLLQPAGTTFAKPITVAIPFDPAKLTGAGQSTAKLVVLHRDDLSGAVSVLTPISIDEANSRVSVLLSSFSTVQVAMPAAVDPALTTLVVSPSSRLANGSDQATVQVSAKNTNGEPYPGLDVVFGVSGGQAALTQPVSVTNLDGQTSGSVSASAVGERSVTATVGGVALSQAATVTFLATAAPALTITSPLPLERLPLDTTITITWTAVNLSETVTLSVSTDRGATYTPIAAGLPATGSTTWTPPGDRPYARLRLSNAAGTVLDEQQGDFTYTRVWFVAGNASGDNDGTSWGNAFTSVETALSRALPGDELWVANTASVAPFNGRSGIDIIGGFSLGNTARSQRVQPLTHSTIDGNDVGSSSFSGPRPTRYEALRFFNGNRPQSGGAIHFASGSTIELSGCVFESNQSGQRGGALMFTEPSDVQVNNCRFLDNTAATEGGAIAVHARDNELTRVRVVRSSLEGNTAERGGGVAVFKANSMNANLDMLVDECTFSGNTAQLSGGAFFALHTSPKITRSSFATNTATRGGGAIYGHFARVDVSRSSFEANVANANNTTGTTRGRVVDGGGALMFERTAGGTVSRCSFTNNTSAVGGGAIVFKGPFQCGGPSDFNCSEAPTVINSVFSGNSASFSGGAMFVGASGNAHVRFSTFTQNTATNGGAVGSMDDTATAVRSSILYDNGTASFGAFDFTSGFQATTNYADQDPLFVSTTDLRLQAASMCIGAATVAGAPSEDFDGNPRSDGAPDIGAYERQ